MAKTSKICTKCKIDKDFSFFCKDKHRKDGMNLHCRDCTSKYYQDNIEASQKTNAEYRKNNPEIIYQRGVKYRKFTAENKPWFSLLYAARHRAKKTNQEFNLTEEYLREIWPLDNCCPVTKLPFTVRSGVPVPTSASLDKIIPSLGYVIGNVAIISNKINSIKNNVIDPEIFRRLANWMTIQLEQISKNQNEELDHKFKNE